MKFVANKQFVTSREGDIPQYICVCVCVCVCMIKTIKCNISVVD
jgi:hypothetical protein